MLYKVLRVLPLLIFFFSSCSEKDNEEPRAPETDVVPVPIEKTNSMKIYVHYMPWFETPATNNGSWGQHWTMATMNPENTDADGKREIAAHYYPAIGPYASGDKDVIECQLLLMKYAGIDGVLVDWYGTHPVYDYPANKTNADALIKKAGKVGLTYALTYEDRTLEAVVAQGAATSFVEGAKADFRIAENNYFSSSDYIKISGKPLLLVFGPIIIQNGTDWAEVMGSISTDPVFLSLWGESGELGTTGSGEYSWVWQNNASLQNFYSTKLNSFDFVMGSAYPGFEDYYSEGGWGDGSGWSIDHNNGETLRQTLEMSANSGVEHLQLITWNDYGEGTMIEPTLEFGTSLLEIVQEFSGTNYGREELDYILTQYELRKSLAANSTAQKSLDTAFNHWVKLEVDAAKAIIDELK